jgi:hypothetical protein
MLGSKSRAMLNWNVIQCDICDNSLAMGGCLLTMGVCDSWTEYDEQAWRDLIDSEHVSNSPRVNPKTEKENNTMLQLTERQQPTATGNQVKGYTFWKPQHCTKAGTKCTVSKVTTDKPDNFGNPVVVYWTANDGQKYSKGFSLAADGLRNIAGVLSLDETKWKGKSFMAYQEVGDEGDLRTRFGK